MSSQDEVVKDILIRAIESGFIPRYSAAHDRDALEKNLESITIAYKEIFKAVNDPLD